MFLSGYGSLNASRYGFTKFFAATLCLIGFCKVTLKLDSYLSSLGVNLGRPTTGMGALGLMMAAGRIFSHVGRGSSQTAGGPSGNGDGSGTGSDSYMQELFMIASAYISAEQEALFCHGYADHYLAQVTWQISNSELTKTYGELMEEHGKKPFGDIRVFIRVVSSDVGASGANIFYSMMDGDHTIILGEALRIKHQYKRGLEEFTCNMESLFQYYKQKLKNIGRLCDIQIRYPANTLSELMKKQNFGKKLIAETVERFKAAFGEKPCSAYEVYCGLCESLFFAKKHDSSTASLMKLEEKIARCIAVRWHDYDIPGALS